MTKKVEFLKELPSGPVCCPDCKKLIRRICSNTYHCSPCNLMLEWNYSKFTWEIRR